MLSVLLYLLLLSFNMNFSMDFPMKYFIQEAISNIMFLIGFLMNINMMVMISLYMKLALVPFHGWFLDLSKQVSFLFLSLILTLHKIFPLYISLMMYFVLFSYVIFISAILICINMLLVSGLKELMIFSSQLTTVWILYLGVFILKFVMLYLFILFCFSFFFYFFMNYKDLTHNFFFNIFFVSGLPPSIVWLVKICMISGVSSFLFMISIFMSVLFMFIYVYIFNYIFNKYYISMMNMKSFILYLPLFMIMQIFMF